MAIRQASSLPARGVHLDCRAQMMRYEQILAVLCDLARWGYNTVLLEYEDRFPYKGAAAAALAPDALTRRQVRDLQKVAADLGITIIPLVQSLGHLEWLLRNKSFRHLREESPRRYGNACGTLCPSHPGAKRLFQELAEQVLELHENCRYFHMGGDEAEVGPECPRCREAWQQGSISNVMLSHYRDLAIWLRTHGPDPIMWCDMPLRHPEALDLLRGHVVMMDWDYWSTQQPTRQPDAIWGISENAFFTPRKWTALQRELYLPYLFTTDGKAVKPFPFTKFLRDRGFQVIVAPAARSLGDSFCVPKEHHVENILGAVASAQEAHVLGVLITSWALRRSPWPLTEYGLMAGAMALQQPGISRREIDAAFALEHFGVADPRLAQIPQLLGRNTVMGLVESRCEIDEDTGQWFGESHALRQERMAREPAATRRSAAILRRNAARARALLELARPRTPRQRARVKLWWWAHDVLVYYAEFAPEMLKETGQLQQDQLREYERIAKVLDRRTDRLLAPLFTDWTMLAEKQTRFGEQLTYLKELRSATTRSSPP
jgi:hypothetical protein